MRIEDAMRSIAEEQHGTVATWQVRALGLTHTEVTRLRRLGEWRMASSRVLVRAGAPATDQQSLMTAVLDASPGAAVAGTTAAWMWGVRGFRPSPIHVVRHRGVSRRPSTLAVVHEVVDLHPSQIKVLDGIPVVSPARVVCELAATHPWRAERVLDWLWSERLLDGRTFRRTVAQLAGRGRTGSTLVRELDEARGPGYVPPASNLERRFHEILIRYGEPPMRRQVDSGAEEWCGRVDFRDPHLPLLVEIQSERFHTALVDVAADRVRRERLEAAGFTVLEAWEAEVWHEPSEVVDRIRSARCRLRAQVA